MLQQQIVVTSSAMHPYRPGVEARQAILRELARREAAGESWPRLRELGPVTGLHFTSVRLHVKTLQDAGLVVREGYALHLTDCGRGAAQTLISP